MPPVTDCHVDAVEGSASPGEREAAVLQYLALAGMGCPNCANRVRNALLGTPGVVDVEVDLPAALATVWYHRRQAGVADLVAAVGHAGRGTHHRYVAVPVPAH